VRLPAWRVEAAFQRVLARAPERVFPGLPHREIEAREQAWWRDVVRASFRAADSTVRFRDFEAFFRELFAHYASPAAWRPRSGAHAALRALREQHLATGIVSNFDLRLPRLLQSLELDPLLDPVVLPSETGTAKPDPAIFRAGLSHLGLAASEAVYVGDDASRDLAGARAAGLSAIDVAGLATLEELPGRLLGNPEARAQP
jgi:putative hydrolase of the HAD superfamily